MNNDAVRQIDLSALNVSPAILWGIFGFTLVVSVIITAILSYHWHAYGMKNPKIIFAQTLYYAVLLALIIGQLYFIITF